MVFFVRITVNQSHLRPICKSTKFNPKIQRTIYLINFQQLRLHVPDFIRTVVDADMKMPKVKRLLLIELKRGGFEITRDERNQVGGYAEDLISNFKDTELQICAFVVGSKIADNITRQANFGDNDRIHLYVTTFSQLIDAAEHRLFGLRRKLACMYDDILGMDLYKQVQLNFK